MSHLCADGWMSPNVILFIGLTVHWAENGHIKSTILDFVKYVHNLVEILNDNSLSLNFTSNRASKSHTDSHLAARISECLHKHGIQGKVCTIAHEHVWFTDCYCRFWHSQLTMHQTITHLLMN